MIPTQRPQDYWGDGAYGAPRGSRRRDGDKDWVPLRPLPPALQIGKKVETGDLLGYAQNLHEAYDDRMYNHIHFEVKKGSTYLNPNDFF